MPRISRAIAIGYPHHVVQRGNNREDIFFAAQDRRQYLDLLVKFAEKWNVTILAYCLMSNHVHLLVRPKDEASLSKMMQGLTLCYTQYINRTRNRTGRLWESRYHSSIIDKETYLWAVARYIEQNPVRAGMAEHAEEYPYSSAKAHVKGTDDGIVSEELFDKAQRADYKKMLRTGLDEEALAQVRRATRTGLPLGSESFIRRMGKLLERELSRRPRGRPKKIPDKGMCP